MPAVFIGCGGQGAGFSDGSRGVGWGSIHFDTAVDAGGSGAHDKAGDGSAAGDAPPFSWAPPYFNIERA